MAIFAYPQCSNIWIDDRHVPYRLEVVRYLELIRTTYSGRRLHEFILRRKPRFVLIMPVKPAPKHSIYNSYATPDSDQDAYMKNRPVMTEVEIGDNSVMFPTGTLGTGNGSNSVVEYHPATWRQLMINRHHMDAGAGPGELLFHELVHSMRELNGKFIRTTVSENLRFDDFEEFCAVVAANIYRQERGFKPLRADHHGFHALATPTSYNERTVGPDGKVQNATVTIEVDPNLSDPRVFYDFYKRPIQEWFKTQPDFCIALARSSVAHNPLRIAADDMGISILDG